MPTHNLFILEDDLEAAIEQNNLQAFILQLEKLLAQSIEVSDFLKVKIYADFQLVSSYESLEPYEIRKIISLFVDNDGVFERVPQKVSSGKFLYFRILPYEADRFIESTSLAFVHLCDCAVDYGIETVKVLSFIALNRILFFLRLSRNHLDMEAAYKQLKVFSPSEVIMEVFLEDQVQNVFDSQKNEFVEFRKGFKNFLKTFDWKTWSPRDNPCPFHDFLGALKAVHTGNKERSYLFQWGLIMAILNGARYNRALTLENSHDTRINSVFQSGTGKEGQTIFFSVDGENGNLEIYDYQGNHLNKVYGVNTGVKVQKKNYKLKVPKSKWLQ